MRLYIVAGKETDSVTHGFLPAAAALGLDVTVLTDRAWRPEGCPQGDGSLSAASGSTGQWKWGRPPGRAGLRPRPGATSPRTEARCPQPGAASPQPEARSPQPGAASPRPGARFPEPGARSARPGATSPAAVVRCDVTDFREIVAAVARDSGKPAAIFSNSDHLQAPTALAAAYFGLPGKDWRAALRAKNKALMRRELGGVYAAELRPGDGPPADAPYPLVVKPREGVASEDVFLVGDATELSARCREIWARRREALVAEEYLPGALHTLETLNGEVLGGFRTTLSPPPHFVEERLDWVAPPPCADQVLAALRAIGVGFGACHTEYVVHEGRARIVEVNYRIIGDHCDFLLADLLGVPVFAWVLRAHLGEPVPPVPAATGHATVDSVVAGRSGTLAAAPGREEYAADGVRLAYWPVRAPGDTIELTRTNRDYLGLIRAVGPDAAAVEAAVQGFRARHTWEIVA